MMPQVIFDETLEKLLDSQFSDYLCHAICREGYCTFERNGRQHRLEAGDCMIVTRRGEPVVNLVESGDFRVEAVYVTQAFIDFSTPQSNYSVRGHLSLFDNPVMRLNDEQQRVCLRNFETIRMRLADADHCFRQEALKNAVESMIIDFFDFHARMHGGDKISAQQNQLMMQFLEMLERGDFRRNREIGYYADKLCVTTKYLSEVSKKVSGLPAAFWITRYTAIDISRLLRDRSLSLTAIADMFGFSSQAHFTHYVQANLGAKPSDFRE